MLDASALPTPAITLNGITVAFDAVAALREVTIALPPGSRQAIVGENGAGKSTLMRVLFGLLPPDSGEILVNGTPHRFTSPADAIALGIGMVQQHFELIPSFTVAENIVLGAEPRGLAGMFDLRQAAASVRELSERSGLPIDPAARVGALSVAAQQRVEILKALYRRARVLILDEPTAALAPSEARDLWAATRRLSESGATLIFVTHKLDDVMMHADHVTVLRRGERILSVPIKETTPAELAGAMVGKGDGVMRLWSDGVIREGTGRISSASSPSPHHSITSSPRLTLQNLTVTGRRGEILADDVSLTVRAGEIMGIAGVDGSGQWELIEAILGLRPLRGGAIQLDGEEIERLPVRARRERGIAFIPEDRQDRAVILSFSCAENMILGRQRGDIFAGAGGILREGAIRSFFTERAAAFDVRGGAENVPVHALSGGNQQKLVLARELAREPRLILAAQPTRGLDFAATAFVHDALRRERDRGAAILLSSLDLEEIIALSDRVAVMLRGKIVAVFDPAEATEARIGAAMTGATSG